MVHAGCSANASQTVHAARTHPSTPQSICVVDFGGKLRTASDARSEGVKMPCSEYWGGTPRVGRGRKEELKAPKICETSCGWNMKDKTVTYEKEMGTH